LDGGFESRWAFVTMVSLAIIRGSDEGTERPLDRELTIGRDPGADLTLDDAGVSRRHARLTLADGEGPVIEDLGSSNGTFVNGERVGGERRLADGDEIRIGETAIEVHDADGAAPATAIAPAPAPQRRAPARQPAKPPPAGGEGAFNWIAIVALILGPLSILLILTGSGSAFYAALPVAVAAIVCGSIGKRAADRGEGRGLRGLALTGQVFGVIGTIIAALAIVALLILNAALDAGAESLSGLIDEVRSEIEGIPLPEDLQVPEDVQDAAPE
jgi:hypothetical protein